MYEQTPAAAVIGCATELDDEESSESGSESEVRIHIKIIFDEGQSYAIFINNAPLRK